MTQEDKELLLKDLCARLPYGVRLHISSDLEDKDDTLLGISLTEGLTPYIIHNKIISTHSGYLYSAEEVKPYLRPMSSMTEEELHEYNMHLLGITTGVDAVNFMIWIYQHYLDILHFIEKGLALEAPDGMYNIKEK